MWVEAFLLLALEQSPSHGYELIRRMTAFGFEAIDGGGVYRILRQLEADGLVGSGWVTSSQGPARREYALTDAGRAYLGAWAVSLRESQFMLDQFFSLHPPPRPPGRVSRGGRRSRPVGCSGRRDRDVPSSRAPQWAARRTLEERPDHHAGPGPAARGPGGRPGRVGVAPGPGSPTGSATP